MNQSINYWRIFGVLAAIFYFSRIAFSPSGDYMINNVNLIFHEAGHVIFWPFGEFISVAGGSFMQLLLPFVFVVYFILRQEYFSAGIVFFWFGENFINLSVYAADALSMELSLLGGEGAIHDWNYLLTRFNILEYTKTIAVLLRIIGSGIMIAGAFLVFWTLFEEKPANMKLWKNEARY